MYDDPAMVTYLSSTMVADQHDRSAAAGAAAAACGAHLGALQASEAERGFGDRPRRRLYPRRCLHDHGGV